MDTAVPMTATQLAIIWPLLGFLLIWMILFAVLAFRPDPAKHRVPANIPLTSGNAPTPSTSAMLHVLIAQPSPTSTIAQASPASAVSTPSSDSSNGAGNSTLMF